MHPIPLTPARRLRVWHHNKPTTAAAARSCPFPTTGPWADGALMRESILSASTTLVGTTGPLIMSEGQDSNGRDLDTTTFCAVNLKAHASLGARFETISTLSGGSLEIGDGEGFQVGLVFRGGVVVGGGGFETAHVFAAVGRGGGGLVWFWFQNKTLWQVLRLPCRPSFFSIVPKPRERGGTPPVLRAPGSACKLRVRVV